MGFCCQAFTPGAAHSAVFNKQCLQWWGHVATGSNEKMEIQSRKSNLSNKSYSLKIEMIAEALPFDAAPFSVEMRTVSGEGDLNSLLMGSLPLPRCPGLCGVQIKEWAPGG